MARLYALQLADQRALEKQGVRENPIRRGGYSGGAAPTQPVRFELASERAEEIQANRTAPSRKGATPTMGVSQVRGGSSWTISGALKDALHKKGGGLDWGRIAKNSVFKAFSGGRAVPSSGLSQFRGGAMERMVGAGHGSDSDSECDSDSSEEYEGMGKLTIIHGGDRGTEVLSREKASRPAIRSGLSAQHSAEAKQMGEHLGKHLLAVKGGGFFELFTKGVVEAGQKGESVAQQTGMPNANAPPPSTGIMTTTTPPTEEQMGGEPKKGGAMFYRKGDMSKDMDEHHEEHTARRFGRTRMGAGDAKPPEQIKLDKMLKKEGAGEAGYEGRKKIYYHDNRAIPMKKKLGGYLSGPYEGMGECGGRTKRGKMMRKQKQIEEGNLLHTLEDDFPEREGREATHGDRTSGKKRTMVFNRERGVFGTNTEPSSSEEEEESSGSGKLTIIHGGARATRAAIVKKVMREKGCSMIEASKYVKAHGLYKGGGVGDKRKASTSPATHRARTERRQAALDKAERAAAEAGEAFDRERAIDEIVRAGTPPRRADRSPPRLVRHRAEAPSPSTPAVGPAQRRGRRIVLDDSPPPAAAAAAAPSPPRRARSGAFDMGDLGDALPDVGRGYEEAMKIPRKKHVNQRKRKPFSQRPEEAEGYDQSTSMDKDSIRKSFAEKRAMDTAKRSGGKKRRAPAGPSDGRRKRAEIVKKVMAEKGCSMIEASKHVKAHGLY